jgi:HD-like signal output (HDOD) protein
MNPPSIKAMVQAVPRSLGSYGPVLDEIEAALQSPQCNLNSIGDAIQKDPDLTARLLRLANSPFFGFANRLSTVAEAVSLLGIQQIQDMIVASSVLEQFKGVPDKLVN